METGEIGLRVHGILFSILFLMHAWAFRTGSLKFFSPEGWPRNIWSHFTLLFAGIILWGVFPVWYHGLDKSFSLLFGKEGISCTWTVAVIAICMLAFLIGKRQAKLVNFSEAHFHLKPTSPTLIVYFFARTIFLISYEMWFRGWFLSELVAETGEIWIPIGINTALYSLIHFFAGRKEAVSAIPFGIVLCLITIETQILWAAAVIHLFLSLGFELNFIRRLNNGILSE